MAEILPTDENTLDAVLELEEEETTTPTVTEDLTGANSIYLASIAEVPTYSEYQASQLSSETPSIPKVAYTIGKKVLSLDVETTGLNPWEYKLIVCTVWDLDEPKGSMRTFAGWDEQLLCEEMFDYIKGKEPDVILAFNAKFESRCFITRAMLYHIKAPWIWSVEWHDMLTMLEGGWKNGLSGTMPAGSEENWLKFFFNEVKPFNIEECFNGVREGRLDEMIIRNRTCVQGQGDMYQLFMYCQSQEEGQVQEEKPSATRIDELNQDAIILVNCEVCSAVNEVRDVSDPGQCWRCLANLPKPTAKNIIREQVRSVDWSLTGLSGDALKKAKAALATNKSELELQYVGNENAANIAIERLKELGIEPHSA